MNPALTPFDKFVRQSLLRWPVLFKTRSDVMRHTFLCNGNALRWEDGIIKSYDDPPEDWEAHARANFMNHLDDEVKSFDKRLFTIPDLRERNEAIWDYKRAELQMRLDHIDGIAMDNVLYIAPEHFAPFWSESSLLFTCDPDNIEPSHKEAVLRMLHGCQRVISQNKSLEKHAELFKEQVIKVENLTPEQKQARTAVLKKMLEALSSKETR